MVLVRGNVADVCTALHLSRVIFRRILVSILCLSRVFNIFVFQVPRLTTLFFSPFQLNFVWSLLYNTLSIPVAAGAFYPLFKARLPPTVAAIAMALSSISVVISSLAIRLYKPPEIEIATQYQQPQDSPGPRHSSRRRNRDTSNNNDYDLSTPLLQEPEIPNLNAEEAV